MKLKVKVTGIDLTTGYKDKVQYKLQCEQPFFYGSIHELKDFAMIGDEFELELTRVDK